jgi:tRNA A37 threonylcarbamoyladenosine modification protein TsaB
MRILGIDTSSPKGSIAITLKNKIISEKYLKLTPLLSL